jgi:HEAT repeat protein
MEIEKQKAIDSILNNLEMEIADDSSYTDVAEKCVEDITELPEDYNNIIIDYSRNLLSRINKENDSSNSEFKLELVLKSLIKRQQEKNAFDLSSEAILHKETEDKLFYVEFLIELDHDETVDILLKALNVIESFDEYSGHAQEEIIEYLIRKKEENALPDIVNCLTDISARVRATALNFIKYFDKEESARYLIKMLETEDWEYNILIILELISKWNKKEFLQDLEKYSLEDWVLEDKKIKEAFEKAINELS